MNQTRIHTTPEQTKAGPVADFTKAVLAEHPHIQLSTLYWFGQTAVRFFVRQGRTGADFFRPCKYGFSQTRVNTKGVRQHKGFVETLTDRQRI